MSSFSDGNSFEEILERCLARVDNNIDKRQGSIIYDALAPACAELAQAYIALDVYSMQTSLDTATGENLDNKVIEYGLTRRQATSAQRKVMIYDESQTPMSVNIGTRFSVPNESGGYNFKIKGWIVPNVASEGFIAECETPGTIGNDYIGQLLPLESINNLGLAIMNDVLVAGDDAETDSELRERAYSKLNQEAFAGNKAGYKRMVENLDGVGKCKVIPTWNGGGTVKLIVTAADDSIPSQSFISDLQNTIDPSQDGTGIGLAPIGHIVTVAAPTATNLNISATLTLENGYTINQVKDAITESLDNYIKELKTEWDTTDGLTVYISKCISAVLDVSHVENVSLLKINNSSSDVTIASENYPILGTVTLST